MHDPFYKRVKRVYEIKNQENDQMAIPFYLYLEAQFAEEPLVFARIVSFFKGLFDGLGRTCRLT